MWTLNGYDSGLYGRYATQAILLWKASSGDGVLQRTKVLFLAWSSSWRPVLFLLTFHTSDNLKFELIESPKQYDEFCTCNIVSEEHICSCTLYDGKSKSMAVTIRKGAEAPCRMAMSQGCFSICQGSSHVSACGEHNTSFCRWTLRHWLSLRSFFHKRKAARIDNVLILAKLGSKLRISRHLCFGSLQWIGGILYGGAKRFTERYGPFRWYMCLTLWDRYRRRRALLV